MLALFRQVLLLTVLASALVTAPTSRVSSSASSAQMIAQFGEALQCMALNVYWEARSESIEGQKAVAAVTLNRVANPAFPDSVCKVVKQGGERRNRCQFSWWCDGKKDEPKDAKAWETARMIAWSAMFGQVEDPTGGALYYHATYVSPRWAKRMDRTRKIGRHVYYVDPTKIVPAAPKVESILRADAGGPEKETGAIHFATLLGGR